MATLAHASHAPVEGDDRFFMRAAVAMALVIAAGFSTQLAMGRSTFASPPLVHAHAIIFMGWVTIYLLQNIFVGTGRMTLHRRLGWLAAGWMVPMIVLGFGVTLAMVRRGQVPFFFQPLQFLVFDPLSVLAFATLTGSAILLPIDFSERAQMPPPSEIRVRSRPSGRTRQMSLTPLRSLTKAIHWPSGDHLGMASKGRPLVTRVALPPLIGRV